MNSYKISFMTKERLFLEYVRDYVEYEDAYFLDAYKSLDANTLEKLLARYPVKKVVNKINAIKLCL